MILITIYILLLISTVVAIVYDLRQYVEVNPYKNIMYGWYKGRVVIWKKFDSTDIDQILEIKKKFEKELKEKVDFINEINKKTK